MYLNSQNNEEYSSLWFCPTEHGTRLVGFYQEGTFHNDHHLVRFLPDDDYTEEGQVWGEYEFCLDN